MTLARRQTTAAVLVLLAAALWVFRQWLFAGQALYWGDMGLYFIPMVGFLHSELTRGILPLWNPWIFSGTPFVGNPQMWPLYPVSALLRFLPAPQFLTGSCVLHVFLAGIFTFFWLARGRARLQFWPATLGALGYMLGGYLVAKAQYPNMLQALAYVPLILWCVERLVMKPGITASVLLGLALGLQLLAAHAQVTLYTIYLGIIYGVFVLATSDKRQIVPTLGSSLFGGAVALALSCGQWLPTVEAQRLANRQALPLLDVNRLHLSAVEIGNFIQPWRFGSPLRGDYVGPSAFWETACYAGSVTVVLALLFLATRLRRNSAHRAEAVFWFAVAVGSIWLALGSQAGLFRVAYAVVPGFRLFHDPARLLLGAAIALPVLGAFGLATLLEMLPTRIGPIISAAIILLTIADLGQFDNGLYPLLPTDGISHVAMQSPIVSEMRSDKSIATSTGRILTIDDINADDFFINWSDFRPIPDFTARIASTGLPNLPMAMGISNAGGYEPLVLRGPGSLYLLACELMRSQSAAAHLNPSRAAAIAPLLGAMSIREIVGFRPEPLHSTPGLVPALSWRDSANRGTVYQNLDFQPRARQYLTWQSRPSEIPANNIPQAWLSNRAILTRPEVDDIAPKIASAPQFPAPVALTEDTPDHVALSIPPSTAPSICLLADTDYPGWHAAINGKSTPILLANGIYRAVYCPQSAIIRRIDYRFRPEAFVLGFYITAIAIMFLTAYGAASITRRRKR